MLECSRRLRVARGTVQARLDKLVARGVVRGFGPEIAPAAIGFGVTAFVTLEIRQRYGHDAVAAHLADIPEVLEAHTITGSGDLLCRIVARSNADLQRVIDQVVGVRGDRPRVDDHRAGRADPVPGAAAGRSAAARQSDPTTTNLPTRQIGRSR